MTAIPCPICRQEWRVRRGRGASTLAKAFHLTNLMELKEDLTVMKQDRLKCDKHKELLKHYCQQCEIALCSDCVLAEHRDHNTVDNTVAHPTYQLDMQYLREELEEKKTVFNKKVVNLSDALSEIEKKGNNLKAEVRQHTQSLIEQLLKNEKKVVEEIEQATQEKTASINTQKDTALTILDEFNACSDLVEISMKEWSPAKFLQERTKIIARVKALSQEIDPVVFQPLEMPDILLHPPHVTMGQIRYSICSNKTFAIQQVPVTGQECYGTLTLRSQKSQPFQLPSVSLIEGKLKLADNKSSKLKPLRLNVTQMGRGEYRLNFTLPERDLYTISVSVGGVELEESPFDVPVANKMGSSMGKCIKTVNIVKSPGAMCVFSDDSIIVQDGKEMVLLNKRGRLMSRIKPSTDVPPQAIAVSTDQHILLAEGHEVFKLTRDSQCVAKCGFSSPGIVSNYLNRPTGIAVNPVTGQVLVLDSMNYRVQQFSPNLTHAVTFINDPGKKYFNEYSSITCDNNGFLYLTDIRKGCINVFTPEGSPHCKIGSKGRRPGQLYEPTLVVAHYRELYVCDKGNKRVSIFDTTNAKFLTCFKPSNVTSVSGIAIDHKGCLLLSDRERGKIVFY